MKRNPRKTVTQLSAAASVAFLAHGALAQDANVGVNANANASVATTTPHAYVATNNAGTAGTDRGLWIGRVGVGWYGVQTLWNGAGTNPGNVGTLAVPVIGIRYWLNNQIGIDGGLGFRTTSGSTSGPNNSSDLPSATGFLLHGGLPIALADGRHMSFELTPELNLGFTSGKANNSDTSGFLLSAGARAGAEIFFGFMNIPQLSLEGSVGLFLATRSGKTTTNGVSQKISQFDLATSQINDPWDFFKANVAARYYF